MNIEQYCQKLQCTASAVGYNDGQKTEYSEQNMPQCHLSATNPT